MSDCDHSFSGDDICNSCGYSIGYLLINAEQEIAALKSAPLFNALANKQEARIAALEKVAEAAIGVYRITERDTVFHNELRDALREAGYLGGGDE